MDSSDDSEDLDHYFKEEKEAAVEQPIVDPELVEEKPINNLTFQKPVLDEEDGDEGEDFIEVQQIP